MSSVLSRQRSPHSTMTGPIRRLGLAVSAQLGFAISVQNNACYFCTEQRLLLLRRPNPSQVPCGELQLTASMTK